jgi:hypothetical protein
MSRPLSISDLIGTPAPPAPGQPPASVPQTMSPAGPDVADVSTTGARSMLDLRGSPSTWFVLLTLATAVLARWGGYIGAGR